MPVVLVDISTPAYWATAVLAVLLLLPLVQPLARQWCFALINLAFIGVVTGPTASIGVGAGLVLCWQGAAAVRRGTGGRALVVAAGASVLALFVVFKLPAGIWLARPDNLIARSAIAAYPVLGVVGFSYVTLRLVDMLRAMREQRFEAPTFPQLVNYLIPFHMLAAGPIARFDEHMRTPAVPDALTFRDTLNAADRITQGFFKVFVLGRVVDDLFLTGFSRPGWYTVFEVQMNFLWIYLDFSGYTDIAVGIGRLLGIHTPENFNKPFRARNLLEFWERWHMSLAEWLRRQLFIPLQIWMTRHTQHLHRVAIGCIAFGITFTLCGAWHQFSVRWIAWGLMQAVALMANYVYRAMLTRRLGVEGVKRYRQNRVIEGLACLATFEYVACSVAIAYHPRDLVSEWIGALL